MIDYVKKKINFIQGQNSYRASKLTIKKCFSGIKAGISLSRSVKTYKIYLIHISKEFRHEKKKKKSNLVD